MMFGSRHRMCGASAGRALETRARRAPHRFEAPPEAIRGVARNSGEPVANDLAIPGPPAHPEVLRFPGGPPPNRSGTASENPMFRLLCFGYPRLQGPDGRTLEELQAHPKRFAVLIYLACHSEIPVSQRESLLPVFWPEADEAHARNSLRQTLHVLRACIGPGLVHGVTGGELRLDRSRLSADVWDFCVAVENGGMAEALVLYHEPFLTDFFVPEATPFMDWLDQRRRSLNERALAAATRLALAAEEGRDPHGASGWWRRALEMSPYNEGVMTSLVWSLANSGNRGGAVAVYRDFCERMDRDLRLDPAAATLMSVAQALRIAGSAEAKKAELDRLRAARDRDPKWSASPGPSPPRLR